MNIWNIHCRVEDKLPKTKNGVGMHNNQIRNIETVMHKFINNVHDFEQRSSLSCLQGIVQHLI